MKTVAIRTDGGIEIGLGHVMRCLSLAGEFRRYGYKVYFLSKLTEGIRKIKQQGFSIIRLHAGNYDDKEVEQIGAICAESKIDYLFIDSYNVTYEYLVALRPYVKKIGYIDDLNKFVYPVDILINGNITAEGMDYTKHSDDEILLLGSRYNLIRDEFRGLPQRVVRAEVGEVMITTGGADLHNMSSRLLRILLSDSDLRDLTIRVVVGSGFTNATDLMKIASNNRNVVLHENVNCMSRLMLNADLAISAGGSTLYELCACGTPTLAFIMADNQEAIVEKMAELGYIINLGWFDKLQPIDVIEALKSVMNDCPYRIQVADKQQRLVDARGTERVVEILESLSML